MPCRQSQRDRFPTDTFLRLVSGPEILVRLGLVLRADRDVRLELVQPPRSDSLDRVRKRASTSRVSSACRREK